MVSAAQRTTVVAIEAKDPSGAVVAGADVNAAATSHAQALIRLARTGIDFELRSHDGGKRV